MSDFDNAFKGVMPPTAGTVYAPKGVSQTGEATVGPFAKNKIHMVTVGANAVKLVLADASGLGAQTGGANVMYLNAGASFTFRASVAALYMYVDSVDAATYAVSVFQREG